MAAHRAFPVRLPSGMRYWSVLDDNLRPVVEIDDYLLHRRLGTDAAESTTQAYANGLALFLDWSESIAKHWSSTVPYLGRFVYWLQFSGPTSSTASARPARGERRVNSVLSAVRGFLRYQVVTGRVPQAILSGLYDDMSPVAPPRLGVEIGHLHRPRARHRLREPKSLVDNATDTEVMSLLTAASNPRDRFIIIAMWRMGLRRGELLGLRKENVHFLAHSTGLGCTVTGPHAHIRHRNNENHAQAKSRNPRVVPADQIVIQAYDQYMFLCTDMDVSPQSDFLLVNLFRAPVGQPMRPDSVNALLSRLSHKANCGRRIRPHMLRHSFATNALSSGVNLDVLKELMGHSWISSTEVYAHPSFGRLREAVEAVPFPGSVNLD